MNMKKILFIVFCISLVFSSCDDSSGKRHLLKIDKPWSERNQTEKLIGCWCNDSESNHTSRRGLKITFSSKLCFYNDGTMESFMTSHSYVNSTDLMYSGVNVKVDNNLLTFDSDKYGSKDYNITISQYALVIPSITSFGSSANWSKCY